MKENFLLFHLNLIAWPRMAKRLLMFFVDACALPLLMLLAFMIRLDKSFFIPVDVWLLPAAALVTITTLYVAGFYRMVIRFLGSSMAVTIVVGMLVSSGLLAALAYMVPAQATPRSVFVIYALLGILYLGGSRFLARRYLLWASGQRRTHERVAIFGAGGAGIQVASALINSGIYQPVAFVDDDRARHGELLSGLPVIDRAALKRLIERNKVQTVLLAMPSASRSRRMEVVRFLEPFGVKVKTVPAMGDIINGKARIEELRDVSVDDLLGRDPVPPQPDLMSRALQSKNVLVTGAGGSIGSELCRQILEVRPSKLVLLEISEVSLYLIERELKKLCGNCG
ncbi:MAG: polysaccharide biosynthesis protein, partial [Alcanivoracaceae bacterium]|nr:polysaccharide biosynthesis protein [Alcanivoracaceae bacterium]